MRRFFALVLCIFLLSAVVSAENAVSSASSTGSVTQGGSCQFSLIVTIRLDSPASGLTFPLGTDVSGVTLNGRRASVKEDEGISYISLKELDGQTGLFSVTMQYTLNKVVATDFQTGKQTVTVPILYGFRYPVEQLQFSITMPGPFETEPAFFSGYHEQDIERSLSYSVAGATISGQITAPLKDSETLFLKLDAPEGMFVKEKAAGGSLVVDAWGMGICAVLALAYYIATMARFPILATYRATPPEGISAGLVSSYLARFPADLTLMVVHWAQLGYLIIQLDGNGRVILHKKMEMGNERNQFEQRTFKNLFGAKQMADATSHRYARLYDNVAKSSQRYAAGFRKGSGNPLLLRILGCGMGLFAGIAVGDCITNSPMWRVFWMVLLGVVFVAALWIIQKGMRYIRHPERIHLYYGLFAVAVLVIIGLIVPAGMVYALLAAFGGLVFGQLGVYGGKRSQNGALIYGELLGLRRYMRRVSKAELSRIMNSNPNYYFELAPFALALGVDKTLAERFDNLHLPSCGWLIAGMAAPRTAGEWYPVLREAVEAMNALAKRPFWEKYSRR